MIELAQKPIPDVIVADVAMPIINGIDATKQIKSDYPSIAVLILTAIVAVVSVYYAQLKLLLSLPGSSLLSQIIIERVLFVIPVAYDSSSLSFGAALYHSPLHLRS